MGSKVIAIFFSLLMMLEVWYKQPEEFRSNADTEVMAFFCQMTPEEFDLVSRTVEAESDRSDNFEGRVLIAETIFNRVRSDSFPNTIEGVCYQSGQFQVVYEGTIWSVGRTDLSDQAVIEALYRIEKELAPNVMYFNNSGYAYGTPYCYEGGNYFVTVP